MILFHRNAKKIIRYASITTLTFIVCWGLLLVIAQIKPLLIDEWRIIYNLKYKDAAGLWGELDFMQQFPRVYLEVIKAFSSACDYSYFSLRFPSFLIGTFTIFFAYRLSARLFGSTDIRRFLFVLIIAASPTFTDYFVQVKQYTMDILLAVLSIWQLLQLMQAANVSNQSRSRYILLCASFLSAPFFSYAYPIIIAPVFVIAFVRSISAIRLQDSQGGVMRFLCRLWVPLIICAAAVVVFYRADAAQLMNDKSMHTYWDFRMMRHGFHPLQFFVAFYDLFALCGAGIVFEIIFGILGIWGFINAVVFSTRSLKKAKWNTADHTSWYCASAVVAIMLLFSTGNLAIGEARLTCFCAPVVSLLIISAVCSLPYYKYSIIAKPIVILVLFIGVAGNAFTALVGEQLTPQHALALHVYENTENAIIQAASEKTPIFISSDIASPYERILNFPATDIPATAMYTLPDNAAAGDAGHKEKVPGDWILKTFPAYKAADQVAVYALNNPHDLRLRIAQLPATVKCVLMGDGQCFRKICR